MSPGDQSIDLSALLRRSRARGGGEGESKLDALLEQHSRSEDDAAESDPAPVTPLDRLRRLFDAELIPAFEELQNKYADKALKLTFDASRFLGGGRDITIEIEFAGAGIRLQGTVMPNLIAFQQTRYAEDDPAGLTASGPTLRTRDLTGETFRDFVCERIANLVHAVAQRK